MKKDIGFRQTGKTTRLIIESVEKQIPIVVLNHGQARLLKMQATTSGFQNLPEPIVINTEASYRNLKLDKVLVDDGPEILAYLLSKQFGCPTGTSVETMTVAIDYADDAERLLHSCKTPNIKVISRENGEYITLNETK